MGLSAAEQLEAEQANRRLAQIRAFRTPSKPAGEMFDQVLAKTCQKAQLRGWKPRTPKPLEPDIIALDSAAKGSLWRSFTNTAEYQQLSFRERNVIETLYWKFAKMPMYRPADGSLILRDCYPKLETLAGALSRSVRTVSDALAKLRRGGLIASRRTGRTSQYLILLPPRLAEELEIARTCRLDRHVHATQSGN